MKRFILLILLLSVCISAHAQLATEKLKYPATATKTIDKMEYCYIAQEKLRLAHNVKGKDYIDGKITKAQWEAYLEEDFDVKQKLIIEDLLIQKEALKKSTKYEVDLDALEKTIISD